MILSKLSVFVIILFYCSGVILASPEAQNTSSISTQSLQKFNDNSEEVKKIIRTGLDLATKNLGYLYGSADPKNKGMDCSGTIYYILSNYGIKDVPRSSELLYQWALNKGKLYKAQNQTNLEDLQHLKPGNLLFWGNTYQTKQPGNASHTMIYIGKNLQGEHLMVGSSDGRRYLGKKVYGVSVFDFELPKIDSKSKFLGYSCIPEVSC